MAKKKPTQNPTQKSGKVDRRYPVEVPCENPNVGNQYARVRKSIIDHFGLKIASNPVAGERKGRKGNSKSKADPNKRPVSGSMSAKSIKVPESKDSDKFKSIPIPSAATEQDVVKFLNSFSQNKPAFYITPGGKTLYLDATAA